MGNVHLKWAFSEAAVLFVRHSPEGKNALSILAHKLGRAAYFMLVRGKAFDRERFLAVAAVALLAFFALALVVSLAATASAG